MPSGNSAASISSGVNVGISLISISTFLPFSIFSAAGCPLTPAFTILPPMYVPSLAIVSPPNT